MNKFLVKILEYMFSISDSDKDIIKSMDKMSKEELDNIGLTKGGTMYLKDTSAVERTVDFKVGNLIAEQNMGLPFKYGFVGGEHYIECGCYYCETIFDEDKIKEWVDSSLTPLCPHCGIDSVMGFCYSDDNNKEVLSELNHYYFSPTKNVKLETEEDIIKTFGNERLDIRRYIDFVYGSEKVPRVVRMSVDDGDEND